MKNIKEIFQQKDKKVVTNLVTAIALGLLLIICGSSFFSNKKETKIVKEEIDKPETENVSNSSYKEELEKELESFLKTVEGVGRAEVMLTLSNKGEIVVAKDTVKNESNTKEIDAQGGQREQYDDNLSVAHKIITGEDGYQKPLILEEIEPKIEGVIISAEGGDDIFVQSQLIKAAQIILDVEPHKVQILKMSVNKK